MGKLEDRQAWREWREYHRALKRDNAVDRLHAIERKKKREKLESDPFVWIPFFFRRVCPLSVRAVSEKGDPAHHLAWRVVRRAVVVARAGQVDDRIHVRDVSRAHGPKTQRTARIEQPRQRRTAARTL